MNFSFQLVLYQSDMHSILKPYEIHHEAAMFRYFRLLYSAKRFYVTLISGSMCTVKTLLYSIELVS